MSFKGGETVIGIFAEKRGLNLDAFLLWFILSDCPDIKEGLFQTRNAT